VDAVPEPDPTFHFDADPDPEPTFHFFYANPDPDQVPAPSFTHVGKWQIF
jgi:hypothetical protein